MSVQSRIKPLTLGILAAWQIAPAAWAASPDMVISQVYGGGGNSGASLTHDFIELFNRGTAPVSLNGWSVQYASSTGTTWQVTALGNAVLQPGQYYLVREAQGTGGTTALPTPDAAGTIALSGTAGKVALVNVATALSGAAPAGAQIVDVVGYGSANFFEATAAPALSNTTAALRAAGGCTDTDNNGADFAAAAPSPRNNAAALAPCGGTADAAPAVVATSPAAGAVSVPTAGTLTVNFSEAVDLAAGAVTVECPAGSVVAANGALTGVTAAVIAANLPAGASCQIKVSAAGVSDSDAVDPPDHPAADFAAAFSTAGGVACSAPDTPIGLIQGAGSNAALTGTQTIQGVVVGDYEYPGTGATGDYLRGFYIQNRPAEADGDPATSDALFVFNGNANSVGLGQVVQVTGTVAEFQGQTQLSGTLTVEDCGLAGAVAPTDVNLPIPTAAGGVDYLERYEGMLVRMPQTLYVTEHFQLGRFGQAVLSATDRLAQPTNVAAPGAAALALQASNDLNRIIVDDELQNQNPDPIRFARGGNPLSAANTLRGGDTVTGLAGVLTYTWAGNAASGNAYRLRPVNALGATAPNFQPANPRPTIPAQLNGSLKVASANLLNFFNTFDGLPDTVDNCRFGVGGAAADCRGADTQAEFDRQWPKTVANLVGTGAAVLLVNEIENDGYGPDSAIQFLVDRLNAATAPGTYAFVNADLASGQVNALGTDAIKVGMIYQPAKVTPVGVTAPLNTGAFGIFQTGAGAIGRSRPALAQAFEENASGARFVAVANHLKSKGSSCADNISPVGPDPDRLDGQGNCNLTRKAAAEELVGWLLTDPTGSNDPDILIAGDLNAYAKEDPVTVIRNAGYVNLIDSRIGAKGYSYVFDGQWGYLDHALASQSLSLQVADVLEWHINADEPSVLDYNTDFKTANLQSSLYSADAFRTSDHDPIVVGLNLVAPPLNTVTGTARADTLIGTSGRDVLTGLGGRDRLSGGAGADQFVYTGVQEGIDTITDFAVGEDRIVLTSVLQSLGISSPDPLAAGYVVCTNSGANAVIAVDPDAAGPALKRSLATVNQVGCASLGSVSFIF